MANERNQQSLSDLQQSLTDVDSFYLVDYQGLSAGQLSKLRQDIRDKGGQMIVAKNTLIHLALQSSDQDFSDILAGPSALVLASEDPAGVAKALNDVAKGNDAGIPAFKGGFVEGKRVDTGVISKLATLGSKQSLQAEMVGVLSTHLATFIGTLEAYQSKLQAEGGSEAEAAS
ncbi:50S ribosomal protein L10 [Deinococcus radiophilus]|uniref:Large ribosomal subunit protein uL10 n=1 Tax=Deinococcus radiophilus TaxID=32062 RepID=A0A431VZV1_9DEIO|nr:50S ribosomal protein L10 [Deinococcus radiophilus]RTR28646.1 50S ribosomal protein L10 [Deinococcus radiophilus]UFA51068.1 50S ribosomal protein L10 [Deinococcus radiophilus]